MSTENRRIRYDIKCYHCEKQFPMIVEIDMSSTVKSIKELPCPFCATWLNIKFDHAIKGNDTLIRRFEPPNI